MPTAASTIFNAQKLEPFLDAEDAPMVHVAIAASQNIARGTIMGELLGTNAKQTFTISGSPTGGSFTITYSGQTSRAIHYNASAADFQSALDGMSSVGPGNSKAILTTVGANPVWTVEFLGQLAAQPITLFTHTDSLTGGTSPAVAVATTQTGVAGTPGTFKPYASGNTDGSQVAKMIAVYDMQTDASGNITFSSTASQAGGDLAQTYKSAPCYYGGTFRLGDLTGLDSNAVQQMSGRIIQGQIGSVGGIVRLG